MQDLTVTLIQTELFWEDREANIASFDKKLDEIEQDTNLIVLPEMFTTGFTMNAERLAEDMDGPTVGWLKGKSRHKGADITGSAIIQAGGNYYNRLLWAKPDGSLLTYDKKHLFTFSGEPKVYSAGQGKMTVELGGWQIRPFVCYDLRFPIWTRNLEPYYDVAIFIANWPERRSSHWRLLLQARAVENQCYVLAVNRVGKDGNGYPHRGDSCVIDPLGNIVSQKVNETCTFTTTLSYSEMQRYRQKFPALKDAGRES